MTPTNELRFVERKVSVPYDDPMQPDIWTFVTRQILQQRWSHTGVGGITGYVWRDVPLVKEEA